MTSEDQTESVQKAPETDPFRQHRIKILRMPQRLLVDIFNWWRNPTCMLAIPMADKLPDDCFVVGVETNWQRRCLEVVVCSAQFPVCEQGMVPEVIPDLMTEFRHVSFDEISLKLNRNPQGTNDVDSIS